MSISDLTSVIASEQEEGNRKRRGRMKKEGYAVRL